MRGTLKILTVLISFIACILITYAEEWYLTPGTDTTRTFSAHYDVVKGDYASQSVYVSDISVFNIDFSIGDLKHGDTVVDSKLTSITITPTFTSYYFNLASVTPKQDGFKVVKNIVSGKETYTISSDDSTKTLEQGLVATFTFEVKTEFERTSGAEYDYSFNFTGTGQATNGQSYQSHRDNGSYSADTSISTIYVRHLSRAVPTFQRSLSTIKFDSAKLAYTFPDDAVHADDNYTCNIYRKNPNTSSTKIKTMSCSPYETNYVEDKTVEYGKTYYYRISVEKGTMTSDFRVDIPTPGPDDYPIGDWSMNYKLDVADIIWYRKYLAEIDEASTKFNTVTETVNLDFNEDTEIDLIDLVQARISLAN